MLSRNTALMGKRVYRGAGQAPNRGQVSAKGAQGYIRRELNKKNGRNKARQQNKPVGQLKGRDGKSDTRSAVAAKALGRQTQLEGRQSAATLAAGGAPRYDQQHQNVVVNDAGVLELPYNQAFGQEQFNALDEANQELLGLKIEGDQQALDFGQNTRQLEQQYGQAQRQTLNENAASGTAFSSKYGTAVSGNANAFANQQAQLQGQNASFLQNQALQRAQIQNSLNQQLALAVQNYGVELGEQAGDLGFGNAQTPAIPAGPAKRNKGQQKKKRVNKKPSRRRTSNSRGRVAAGRSLKKQLTRKKSK